MNFFKKHILKIEITLLILLIIAILLSVFSFFNMFVSMYGGKENYFNFLNTLWLIIFYPNFIIYFKYVIGLIINIIFYAVFLVFPILGIILKQEKKKYIFLHICLILLIGIHFLIFDIFYYTFRALGSV